MSARLRYWLADVPVVSLVLLRLCYADAGRSVVVPEWRWRRCGRAGGRR
jgi:hypothetical protein